MASELNLNVVQDLLKLIEFENICYNIISTNDNKEVINHNSRHAILSFSLLSRQLLHLLHILYFSSNFYVYT